MNLVTIGTGYVGLTTGLGFAKLGNRVACVDTNADKIAKLDLGEAPFFEPGLLELLREQQETGNIIFTINLSEVINEAQVIVLAVGTPPNSLGAADLSYLFTAADEIGKLIDHEVIVVIKSTVPVGTNRIVLERIKSSMRKNGKDDLVDLISIASIPEFLREGSAIKDFFNPDRIVIGVDDDITFQSLELLHSGIQTTIIKTTIESAEMIKYASNAFLATKISFINEIANIAEHVGADIKDISRAIGLDKRIGPYFLNAGIGYGGSCFPKDVSALYQIAGTYGYDFKLLSSVIEVNNQQRDLFMKKIISTLHEIKGRRIAIWGLAFKSNTDDIRESAALDLVRRLYSLGAEIVVYDPKAMSNSRKQLPDGIQFANTAIDAADGAEALVVLTEWNEFKEVSFYTLKARMIDPIIFDGRNLLSDLNLEKLGFKYIGVGLCSEK